MINVFIQEKQKYNFEQFIIKKKLEYSLKKAQLISSLYLTIPHPKIEKKDPFNFTHLPSKNPKNPFKFPTHKYSWIYTLIT